MGQLYVATGQDQLAQQQFATRLATPNLSIGDRAYTLLLATFAFSREARNATRMAIALQYLAQLDALPAAAIVNRFVGHVEVARSYYLAGDGDRVLAHVDQAFALVPAMPFERRNWETIDEAFLIRANVLSGRPNGRAAIDSIGRWLSPLTQASPALIARDSAYVWLSRLATRQLKDALQQIGYLGSVVPPVIAHYWWNTETPPTPSAAAPGAITKPLADGKIRVLEYGDYNCGACLAALPTMERLRRTAPSNVEIWYVSYAGDEWGATRSTPDQVAQHLKHYYLERKRYGFPIALWIGPRRPDVDGGTLIQPSPTFEALAIQATPTFVVTDGQGIVRHIQVGLTAPLLEATLHYLTAEAARASGVATSTAAPAATAIQ